MLRTIGKPEVRFKQDPVRLIRLIKFQARYGFHVDPEAKEAFEVCRQEIVKSSPARILEEFLRMLESGAAASFFRLMAERDLLGILFPQLMQAMRTPQGKIIFHYLSCADKIYQHKGKNTLDRSVLTACLIYPLLEHELNEQYLKKKQTPHIGDITMVTSSLIKEILIQAFSHFPRRITATVISILVAQYRITPLSGKRHYREKLLRHKDFDLALRFLKLRALVDANLVDIYTSMRNQYRQIIHHSDRKHHHPPPQRQYIRRSPSRARPPSTP